MNEEQKIELITGWINDSLSQEQQEQFQQLLDKKEIDRSEVQTMRSLYRDTGRLPEPEPPEELKTKFYARLDQLQHTQNSSSPIPISRSVTSLKIWRWSAVAAVFVAGLMIGNLLTPFEDYKQDMQQLSSEVSQMREVVMLNLLDDQSPVERLKAVNIGGDMPSADQRVIESLLSTLNYDPNINVRLASIEALIQHGENPVVRRGLVQSISRQESPQVQVALADAMVELQENGSVEELRRLLDQEELDSSVREKLKYTIAALS